jgi:3-phosphoshikimate 1-carboxyvinyltransferase
MAHILKISSRSPLIGQCAVPGDKSISHRAVIFGSIAKGRTYIRNFLDGHDCRATIGIMRAMGVTIDEISSTQLVIHGVGLDGLQEPENVLDCDNSGTTMRLLAGALAGQAFVSVLSGTAQIRGRPMARIVDPLRTMNAQIFGRQNGRYAPLTIVPSRLKSIEYTMPIASAQVKSSLLLAGLYAHGLTVVRQPGPARDHTERMLGAMGAPIAVLGNTIHSERPQAPLKPLNITIPGDISSAAFLLVAASAQPDSKLTILDVGINSTRTGIVDALSEMGADIQSKDRIDQGGEPVADLVVSGGGLRGMEFGGEQIVTMIDELPVLAVAATQAAGRTVVRDAQELRVKETDRIATTVSELKKMGAQIQETTDGFIVDGPTQLSGTSVDSHRDHRLAMALAVASLIANGETTIHNAHVTADSFPGFESTLRALNVDVQEMDRASEND